MFTTSTPASFDLKQSSLPKALYDKVAAIYGVRSGSVTYAPAAVSTHESSETDGEQIKLVDSGSAKIKVRVAFGTTPQDNDEELTVSARIPQIGSTYQLPIQHAPLFGENSFELALDESGRVTKLKYAGGGDAGGGLGVITDALTARDASKKSAADQAAEVQGEADLIYQQQRRVLCQADPKTCPKE